MRLILQWHPVIIVSAIVALAQPVLRFNAPDEQLLSEALGDAP